MIDTEEKTYFSIYRWYLGTKLSHPSPSPLFVSKTACDRTPCLIRTPLHSPLHIPCKSRSTRQTRRRRRCSNAKRPLPRRRRRRPATRKTLREGAWPEEAAVTTQIGRAALILPEYQSINSCSFFSIINHTPGWDVSFGRGFVNYFLRVPKLNCSCPAS